MYRYLIILVLFSLFTITSCAQVDKQDYQGEWIGFLPNRNSFNFKIILEKSADDKYQLEIANDKTLIKEHLESSDSERLQFDIAQELFFDLKYAQDGQVLTGFIKKWEVYLPCDLTQ